MSQLIYSRFNRPPKVAIKFDKPSLTEQCHKDSCDIDVILKRYQQTGFLVNPLEQTDRTPTFGDFTEAEGYFEYQNRLIEISSHFDELPARIRKIFDNDYQQYILAMNDPGRTQELIDLGLLRASTTNDQPLSNTQVLEQGSEPLKSSISDTQNLGSDVEKQVGTVTPT